MVNQLLKSIATIKEGESSTPKRIIKQFYDQILHEEEANFQIWKASFTRIHGYLDTQRKIKKSEISAIYEIGITNDDQLFKFIYALEIYYSIVLKFLAYKAVSDSKIDSENLLSILTGEYLIEKHILNYDHEPIYTWFLYSKEFDVFSVLIDLIAVINSSTFDGQNGDFIKIIFESIFPGEIRHSMGEFYTPDWLVKYVNDTLILDSRNPEKKKYLDPTCGSGTFLVDILERYKKENPQIVNQIYGVDLNPLSTLAAKTNIIIVAREILRKTNTFYVLPVFNADSINSPFYQGNLLNPNLTEKVSLNLGDRVVELTPKKISYEDLKSVYISLITNTKLSSLETPTQTLYNQLSLYNLNHEELNKFLSVYAPYVLSDIDFIIGNPPWVNWEYLPKEYKKQTIDLWQYYGLFDFKGRDFSFIKEDISSILTYTVIDRHLRDHGKIGFVIKETLFKSSKHGAGFRKFHLKNSGKDIGVYRVDDLTKIRPFTGVINRTAVLFAEKNKKTEYPVEYKVWTPTGRKASFSPYASLEEVLKHINFIIKHAKPVDGENNSGWITIDSDQTSTTQKVLGLSFYKARTGTFTGGANAIFWLNILDSGEDRVKVKNINERAKIKAKDVTA
ncbi:MAG TPA: N-6 DNA methylase, partial [Clostridia bacterium]